MVFVTVMIFLLWIDIILYIYIFTHATESSVSQWSQQY